jgi:hypothetical protein
MCRVRNYEEYAAIFNRMQYDLYHRGMVCQGFVVPSVAPRIPSRLPRTAFGFNQGPLKIETLICVRLNLFATVLILMHMN